MTTEEKHNENLRMARKIVANAHLPLTGSNFFYFNDPEMAKEITEKGKEFMAKLTEWARQNGIKIEADEQ